MLSLSQPCPIDFRQDPDREERYARELEQTRRDAIAKGFGFCVAPELTIETTDGQRLTAGDEVTEGWFIDPREPSYLDGVQLPQQSVRLYELVGLGYVLECCRMAGDPSRLVAELTEPISDDPELDAKIAAAFAFGDAERERRREHERAERERRRIEHAALLAHPPTRPRALTQSERDAVADEYMRRGTA